MKSLLFIAFIVTVLGCHSGSPKYVAIQDRMYQFVPRILGVKYFTSDSNKYQQNILDDWADKVLFNLKEPKLNSFGGSGEIVRFVWLRAFENPVVIRLNKFPDTIYANIKELKIDGSSAAPTEILKDTIFIIDKNTWNQAIASIEKSDFWNTEYSDTLYNKDGAIWYLEYKSNEKYKMIQRWDSGDLTSKALIYYLGSFLNFAKLYVRLKSNR